MPLSIRGRSVLFPEGKGKKTFPGGGGEEERVAGRKKIGNQKLLGASKSITDTK